MHRKIKLFFAFSALLLTMCKWYENVSVTPANGLSCKNYTDHRIFEWRGEEYMYYIREEGVTCSYSCPDGTVSQSDLPGKFSSSSPLYSASKEDLEARFCGIAPQPTPTQTPASTSPPPTASPSPTVQASPTVEISPTPQPPLLTGNVTMCDTGVNLISFRLVDPAPDLTGKTLTVQISDMESTCAINPVNPSLLTCTIPVGVTFPARIVVSVDGAVVNDFTHDGVGCVKLTTPFPSPTP